MGALGGAGGSTDPDSKGTWREEAVALLALSSLPGVGPVCVRRLMEGFGSARAALAAPRQRFTALAGGSAAEARGDPEVLRSSRELLERCVCDGVRVLPVGHARYPSRLMRLTDPPPLLFLRGRLDLLESPAGVAVVGARRATARARDTAERLGRTLGKAGITVVSGMALGVDGAAHVGALAVGGDTLAVLAGDVTRPSPASHRELHRRIGREGLLVSEFAPGTPPLPHHFPRRNRLLAGLARAVVVVEAGRSSGALITVGHALDLGLDVFAVPGPIDLPQCAGTNALIRDGAGVVVSADVLLADLGCGEGSVAPGAGPDLLPDAARLLQALTVAPLTVDELVRRSNLDVQRVLAALAALEVDGWAERASGTRYRRAG